VTQTADNPSPPAVFKKNRQISWDVIRVLAVLGVVAQHATHAGRINHPELGPSPIVFPLQIGASALVMISAYFACASLAKGRPGNFLRNRLARLVPAYLVAAVATYAVLTLLSPPGWSQLRPRDLLFNLLMLQNWVPDVRFVDYSYWTLPVQVSGFVVAAALFASPLGSGRGLRALLWTMPLVPLVLRLYVDQVSWLKTVYIGLAMHRVHLFVIGVALWLWSKGRLPGWQALGLSAIGMYAQYVHTTDLDSTIGVAVMLGAMAAAAIGPDWGRVLGRHGTAVVRWLAGISYGMYLLNQEIGYLLMYRVHQLGGSALPQLAVALCAAITFGWLLTRWVERPAHRALMADTPLAKALSWLVSGRAESPVDDQLQRGSSGSGPRRPDPVLRPVSQASNAAPGPLTGDSRLLPALLASTQLR
jgi:peptidoglycan/LPS O-acetylase OafA/YrhL